MLHRVIRNEPFCPNITRHLIGERLTVPFCAHHQHHHNCTAVYFRFLQLVSQHVADGMRWTCFMKHRDPSPTSSQGDGYMWGASLFTCFFSGWLQWIGSAIADLMVALGISGLDRVRTASGRCSLSLGTSVLDANRHSISSRPPTSRLRESERAGIIDQHMHRRPASTAHLLLVISFLCLGSEPVNWHGPNPKSITRGAAPSSDTLCSLFRRCGSVTPRSMPNLAATAQLMQPCV